MASAFRRVLLFALLGLLITSFAVAQVMPDEEDDFAMGAEQGAAEEAGHTPYVGRALFPNATSQSFPTFPAGSKANAVLAFQNNENDATQIVFLVTGLLQPAQQYHTIIQNFSVVRQAREVKQSETVSFQYTFTPDARLEPGEYNLVIGLYAQDTATNQTYYMAVFNSSVMVEDPIGTDPRTILTYLTLLAIAAGVAYVIAVKLGLVKMIRSVMHSKSRSSVRGGSSKNVEMGTSGPSYDPAYINPEHQRYREQLLRQKSASPHQHHSTASPNKKK